MLSFRPVSQFKALFALVYTLSGSYGSLSIASILVDVGFIVNATLTSSKPSWRIYFTDVYIFSYTIP